MVTYTACLQVKTSAQEGFEKATVKQEERFRDFKGDIEVFQRNFGYLITESRDLVKRELEVVKGEVKAQRQMDIEIALEKFRLQNNEDRKKELAEQDQRTNAKFTEQDAKFDKIESVLMEIKTAVSQKKH